MEQPRNRAAQMTVRRRMLKAEAKKRLLLQFWPCVAAGAAVILPTFLFSLLTSAGLPDVQTMLEAADPMIYLPQLARAMGLQFAFSLLLSPVSMGVYAFYLAVARDQKQHVLSVFAWAGEWKKLKTAFFAAVWYLLLALFWTVALAGVPALLFWGSGQFFGQASETLALSALGISGLLLLAGALLAYAKVNSYLPAMFMLAANPGIPVRRAFSFCAGLMRGRVVEFLLFRASFLGWELLAALTYNISVFFVTPYFQLSVAAYTQRLMRAALEEDKNPERKQEP